MKAYLYSTHISIYNYEHPMVVNRIHKSSALSTFLIQGSEMEKRRMNQLAKKDYFSYADLPST